jgi:hypothetical protein
MASRGRPEADSVHDSSAAQTEVRDPAQARCRGEGGGGEPQTMNRTATARGRGSSRSVRPRSGVGEGDAVRRAVEGERQQQAGGARAASRRGQRGAACRCGGVRIGTMKMVRGRAAGAYRLPWRVQLYRGRCRGGG